MSQHSSSQGRKNEDLDDEKVKLQEELQKTNEKLDNVAYNMTLFMNMRRILENQSEQFKLQLEDVEREREANKEKLESVEKLITENERDKTEGHLHIREKNKILNAQRKLVKRKEELEKLHLNTEKVLQSEEAEGVLTRMTEKKKVLEDDKEQLHEQEEGCSSAYQWHGSRGGNVGHFGPN